MFPKPSGCSILKASTAPGTHSLPKTNEIEACAKSQRWLLLMLEAKQKGSPKWRDCALRLKDSMKSTNFGMATEPGVLLALCESAQCVDKPADEEWELRKVRDALYVVLRGAAEVVRGPIKTARALTITVESASNLHGNCEDGGDTLDPYVILRLGGQEFKSQVMMDAGADPKWNWSFVALYNGEADLEFTVMEWDQFSKDDVLGVVTLSHIDYTSAKGFSGSLKLCPSEIAMIGTGGDCADYGTLQVKVSWGFESSANIVGSETLAQTLGANAGTGGRGTIILPPGGLTTTMTANDVASTAQQCERSEKASNQDSVLGATSMKRERKAEKQVTGNQVDVDRAGEQLGLGDFFGIGDGGGVLRTIEDTRFFMVPRVAINDAYRAFRGKQRDSRYDFIRVWFPGFQTVDLRTFQNFASAFVECTFPRGHVLCRAGASPGDACKRIVLLKEGTCSIQAPRPSVASTAPTMAAFKPLGKSTLVGTIGPGAVIACASALFGLEEPFTIVAEEAVTILAVDIEKKPLSTWPKSVTHALKETLRTRADWHAQRYQIAPRKTIDTLEGKATDCMPAEWTFSESPKLKNKELTLWRAETLRDLFDSEGWPGGAPSTAMKSASMPQLSSCSSSQLPSLVVSPKGTRTAGTHTPCLVDTARTNASSLARTTVSSWMQEEGEDQVRPKDFKGPGCGMHGTPSARGTYALNSGLGRCPTPWGAWSPSGMLPAPRPGRATRSTSTGGTGGKSKRRRSGSVLEKPSDSNVRSRVAVSTDDPVDRTGGERDETEQQRKVKINLKCPSDLRRINGLAAAWAVSKMCRQQLRAKSFMYSASAPARHLVKNDAPCAKPLPAIAGSFSNLSLE